MKISAKLTRPRLFGVLARHRLFTLLNAHGAHSSIWLNGPPGSGKTTLVASYLEARDSLILWYQVDSSDTDPATFFYYLQQAVATHAVQRDDVSLPLLTPEYRFDLPGFARRFFRALYNLLPPNTVIVFDDAQHAMVSPLFCGLLACAVNEIPDGAQLIFISRLDAPQELSRAIVTRRLISVGWDDLRLTLQETRAIVEQAGKGNDAKVSSLHDYCGGWATGLTLMLAGGKLPEDTVLFLASGHEAIFNYFAAEIFQHLPDAYRKILVRTAFLSSITEHSAMEISGEKSAPEVLYHLYRQHYFTDRRCDQQISYVFHALFREFLLRQGRETLCVTERAQLAHHAARLLELEGYIEEAATLYIESATWGELTRLICQHGLALINQGRGGLLEPWVNQIPTELLGINPWLYYWRGMALLPFNPEASRRDLANAFYLFKAFDAVIGMYLALASQLESFFYATSLMQLDPWIEELEQLKALHPQPPSMDVEVQFIAALNSVVLRRPQHPILKAMADRAESLLANLSDPSMRIRVANFVAFYRIFSGDFKQAGIILDAVKPSLAHRLPPLPLLVWKGAKSLHEWCVASYENALQTVDEALQIAEASGVHVLDAKFCAQGVYASLGIGDVAGATTFLTRMQNLRIPLGSLDISHVEILRAGILLVSGDAQTAATTLIANMSLAEQNGWSFITAMARVQLAQTLIALNNHAAALQELQQAQQFVNEFPSHILQFHILRVAAEAFFSANHDEQGLAALRQGFGIAREQGYMNCHPWWVPKVMSELCAKALDADIEVPYVQTLIKVRSLRPENTEIEQWPWHVRIYTLGCFSVVKDEQWLNFAPSGQGNTQGKPLLLLKALIALGGREVSAHKIVDLLWPDAEGDNGYRTLNMTLKRLRTALGSSEVIQLRNGHLALSPHHCWVDSSAFERGLARADSQPADLKKSLLLYQGLFLSQDTDLLWTIPLRERLNGKFLHYYSRYGQHLEQTGQWQDAISWYYRGLDVDPSSEIFYQHLIICYEHLNQQAEAQAALRRYQKIAASLRSSGADAENSPLLLQITR